MSPDPLDLLKQLIALPSVNPRLTANTDPNAGESRVTAFLQAFAEEQGWPWLRQKVHDGRDNFLALVGLAQEDLHDAAIQAHETGNTSVILFEAHQDTVATEGMTVPPFEPQERNGRIYGRGACDVKGGLAAILAALSTIRSVAYRKPILLASTINEECGFSGIRALNKLWSDDEGEVVEA
ncbi:MAG: M20/M25/M40 family metallo-hydrolase, partial [Lacipirellulaceae bacterium]